MLLSPWGWHSWQGWSAAREAQAALHAQQHNTQALRVQTAQLLSAQNQIQQPLADVAAWTESAQQQGLEVSSLALEKPHANDARSGLQQLPVHVKVHGSWQAWLNWLSQTTTRSPGVTLSSLELKADPRGGISAQLLALLVQSSASESGFALASAADAAPAQDPFNPQHWTNTQHAVAAQHPSYARWVVPELSRPRETLEQFPRERLQYVGHLTSGAELEALIKVQPVAGVKKEAVMWSVHRVHVGNHLGTHYGKVLSIAQDHVLVQELVLTPSGEWQPQEVRLPLQEGAP